MAEANLKREEILVQTAKDSIVVINALTDIPGGRALNVSGLAEDVQVIHAGHVIIQNDSSKEVYPLGVSEGAYVSLPAGHSYLGVLKASVLRQDARAAIVTSGQINAAASPYPVTDSIKSGLPLIQFLY